MTDVVINKLVVIGVGLIGGSFALALRKAELVNAYNRRGTQPGKHGTRALTGAP